MNDGQRIAFSSGLSHGQQHGPCDEMCMSLARWSNHIKRIHSVIEPQAAFLSDTKRFVLKI